MADCPYAEMDWYRCKAAGHDGPHESVRIGGPLADEGGGSGDDRSTAHRDRAPVGSTTPPSHDPAGKGRP